MAKTKKQMVKNKFDEYYGRRKGLWCCNHNGSFEFIPLESMKKASQLIVKIVENNTKKI